MINILVYQHLMSTPSTSHSERPQIDAGRVPIDISAFENVEDDEDPIPGDEEENIGLYTLRSPGLRSVIFGEGAEILPSSSAPPSVTLLSILSPLSPFFRLT
jgi:hypothetical protein